ncbi:hypothetical protein D3C78_1724960 [compost metagenome]
MQLEPDALPPGYIALLETDEFLRSDAFIVITKALPEAPFYGSNGLKSRSGLMEFIYDI